MAQTGTKLKKLHKNQVGLKALTSPTCCSHVSIFIFQTGSHCAAQDGLLESQAHHHIQVLLSQISEPSVCLGLNSPSVKWKAAMDGDTVTIRDNIE